MEVERYTNDQDGINGIDEISVSEKDASGTGDCDGSFVAGMFLCSCSDLKFNRLQYKLLKQGLFRFLCWEIVGSPLRTSTEAHSG